MTCPTMYEGENYLLILYFLMYTYLASLRLTFGERVQGGPLGIIYDLFYYRDFIIYILPHQ